MIAGRVNQDQELAITVPVLDSDEQAHALECIVDTGFAGHLALPNSVILRLDLGPPETAAVIAANQTRFNLNAYHGIVLWQGRRQAVRIIEAEGTPLIGIGLLWGSLLTAAITDNGAVTISPLSTSQPQE